MNPTNDIDQQWPACQGGEVGQLVRKLQSRQNARLIRRRVSAVVLLLVAVSAGYYFIAAGPASEPSYGGIVCSRIHELAPKYMAGDLDPQTAARIEKHLEQCENCQQWMREMMPNAPRQTGRLPALVPARVVKQRRDPALADHLALGQFAAR